MIWMATGAHAQTATGGTTTDIDVNGVTYRIHTFTSGGTFTVPGDIDGVEYLIVGGGGGAGEGGGGAGGFLTGTTDVTSGIYAVTVGNGGVGDGGDGGVTPSGTSGNGEDSSVLGIVAIGGGGGGFGKNRDQAGGNGGSGGGASIDSQNRPGRGTIGQGNDGAVSGRSFFSGGGGGGGAGTPGEIALPQDNRFGQGGNGGDGLVSSITGSPVFYAGGGGGGVNTNQSTSVATGGGNGGQGGGGDGARRNNGTGTSAVPNTGGGGGGSEANGGDGGNGGSGIVILRYVVPTVSITHTTTGTEDAPATVFTLTQTAVSATDTVVSYVVSGTATSGLDFPVLSNIATIPAGSTQGTITFDVTDDAVVEDTETVIITLTAVTSGLADLEGPTSATNTITDNDAAAINVTPTTGLVTTETGGTATFSVILSSEPTATVTITLTLDTTEGALDQSSLVFTPANWNTAQTVTVTGVNDTEADGDVSYTIQTSAAVSADVNYNGIDPENVSVTNNADSVAPNTPTQNALDVGPGGEIIASGTAEPGTTVIVTFPDNTTATTTATSNGTYSIMSGPNQPSGDVRTLVTDVEGNATLAAGQPYSDVLAPLVPVLNSAVVNGDGSLTVTGRAELGVTVTITFPDGRAETVFVSPDGTFEAVSLPNQPSGEIAAFASDIAGNDSSAVSQDFLRANITERAIAEFQYERANQLLTNQPDLLQFLRPRSRTGFAAASLTNERGNIHLGLNQGDLPFWTDFSVNWSQSGTTDSLYILGAFGAHAEWTENLLVGAMVQLDYMYQEDGPVVASGNGWLVGPYFLARAPASPLFFEGRLLYGETSNEVSPFGTYTDDFDTQRWLVMLKVAGDVTVGATRFSPNIAASYTSDRLQAYTDSQGANVASQQIEVSQLSAGVDFAHLVETQSGTFEFFGGLAGIYSHTHGTNAVATFLPEFENGRARVQLGLHFRDTVGRQFSATTSYDGLGSDHRSIGVDVRYEVSF